MKKSVFGRLALAATVLVVFLYSCANPLLPSGDLSASASSRDLAGSTYTLWAGQTINAGTVVLTQDANNLYITYSVAGDFVLNATHVWLGSAPIVTNGRPDPGQYDKDTKAEYVANRFFGSQVNVNGVVTVPLTPAIRNSPTLVLYTHATLSSPTYGGQTAFAGGFYYTGAGGWFYRIDTNLGNVPFVVPTTTTTVPVTAPPAGPEAPVVYQNISGFVFHDYDADGVKDAGEPGLPGVEVTLSTGAVVTTGSNGEYSFGGLLAQSYTVASGGKTGFFPTEYDSPVTSRTVTASATDVNFGLSFETISGFTFRDYDADGVKDAGEPAVSGVTLTLSGATNGSTASAADGSYSFTNLKGGSAAYTVSAGNVAGEFHTPYLAPVTSWNGNASAVDVNFGFSHETVTGLVFYDANHNDIYDAGEPLLEGFAVRLNNGSPVYSDVNGAYTFDNLFGATTYTVSADDKAGFVHSVASSRTVTPALSQPAVANFGFAVDYSSLLGKTANGFTIGYWKTNIDKAISGKTNGIQVPAATLRTYVANLGGFQLFPLNVASLSAASAILSKTGSVPSDLLAKQLMGSELNYQNGAYIGGNALVTYFFLYDGEYMLANPGSFSSTQLLAQKDRYDAYNNTHGGALFF